MQLNNLGKFGFVCGKLAQCVKLYSQIARKYVPEHILDEIRFVCKTLSCISKMVFDDSDTEYSGTHALLDALEKRIELLIFYSSKVRDFVKVRAVIEAVEKRISEYQRIFPDENLDN